MPKAIIYILLVMTILAMIPPAIIARTRAVPSDRRRIHMIQDMDNQPKFRAQHAAPTIFADGRAMRPPMTNTISRGRLADDDHYNRGVVRDQAGQVAWATTFPSQVTVDMPLMRRGQEEFNIYCRPCHGDSGYGDGIVHKRANELMMTGVNGTTWVQPKSLHEPQIRIQPPGQIFNTITHGIRTMGPYESQINVRDRWAIVAYVKALQRSQHAQIEDLPSDQRENLPVVPLPPQQEMEQSPAEGAQP